MVQAAGLKRPMLVGWSHAGRVISDYVTNGDADRISGFNFVDASIKFVTKFVGDNVKNLPLSSPSLQFVLFAEIRRRISFTNFAVH